MAATSRIEQPARGSRPGPSATTADAGTVDRARSVIRAGRPTHGIAADGPETTASLTRPLRSPARMGPQPLTALLGAGRDSAGVHQHRHQRR